MRTPIWRAALLILLFAGNPLCLHASLVRRSVPADVPASHWAHRAVMEVLQNGVMSLPDGRAFHGEAKVTRTQAVIALARLAQALEAGKWRAAPSVPPTKADAVQREAPNWKRRPLTRYEMAVILARFGDYIANGLPRPPAGAQDLGKSVTLPDNVKVTVSPKNPAYSALVYLTSRRMLAPDSPLLKPGDTLLRGAEMSAALAQMADGLADRLTPLGHDANGETIDSNSPRPNKPPNGQ